MAGAIGTLETGRFGKVTKREILFFELTSSVYSLGERKSLASGALAKNVIRELLGLGGIELQPYKCATQRKLKKVLRIVPKESSSILYSLMFKHPGKKVWSSLYCNQSFTSFTVRFLGNKRLKKYLLVSIFINCLLVR
jgi:hypothetical protein